MVSAFNPFFLPVADEALEKGYVELLRAGLADKPLFVSLHRQVFDDPGQWGRVLAEITLNLATLYSADGDLNENEVIAAVAVGYRDSLRKYLESAAPPAKGAKAKTPRSLGKAPSSKGKVLARTKAKTPAKAKSTAKLAAKSAPKSVSKSAAGRKSARKA